MSNKDTAYIDQFQTLDDVRAELKCFGIWDAAEIDNLADSHVASYFIANVQIEGADEAAAMIRLVERVLPPITSESPLDIDADDTGGFNVVATSAKTFAQVWATTFCHEPESARLDAVFNSLA